ncbi:hypothetical protein KAR91_37700 [Candidatus Pacearchaeota archaeon]|nr:hypothetical protein [Candidatus Pacearchaeota archaeon]
MKKVHIKKDRAMSALCGRSVEDCSPLIIQREHVFFVKPALLCKRCRCKYNLMKRKAAR